MLYISSKWRVNERVSAHHIESALVWKIIEIVKTETTLKGWSRVVKNAVLKLSDLDKKDVNPIINIRNNWSMFSKNISPLWFIQLKSQEKKIARGFIAFLYVLKINFFATF